MTTLADHLSDETLSALLDAQLTADEERAARVHLEACSTCARRLGEFRSLVSLLHRLPDVEPPRDFTLGPRLVAEPANVIRLQRWYTWSRAAAASLAAVFVFLVAGTLYLDVSRPVEQTAKVAGEAARDEARPAQAPAVNLAAPASGQPTTAPVAPAAPPAPAAAPTPRPAAPAAALRAQPSPAAAQARQQAQEGTAEDAVTRPTDVLAIPDPSDQVKAATRVSALATPTSVPIARPSALGAPSDTAAPLRAGASVAGVLAALAVLGALVVRHRLQSARSDHP